MPRIIPIKDMKDTGRLSSLCSEAQEPIFVTKNGYGDMVVMSMDVYERTMAMQEIYGKLAVAEASIADGQVLDAKDALRSLRAKYGL